METVERAFDYAEAFSRTRGWVTTAEQQALRGKRVAIAGLGGVGGSHLLTLTRLGVGAFSIADFDRFELVNFNRQAGASCSRLGRAKVDALAEMALDINPDLDIRRFEDGVDAGNVAEFLRGADVYVDGIDAFAIAARRTVFAACRHLDIPAITAAPLGMSVALMTFLPDGVSFDDYFQLDGVPEDEQLLRFLVGLAPGGLHLPYLVDRSSVDLAGHRGPSTPMACELCAGVAATEALKILLGRGPVRAAPHGFQFDAYRQRWVHTWRPWGNRNPLQQLRLWFARRMLVRRTDA